MTVRARYNLTLPEPAPNMPAHARLGFEAAKAHLQEAIRKGELVHLADVCHNLIYMTGYTYDEWKMTLEDQLVAADAFIISGQIADGANLLRNIRRNGFIQTSRSFAERQLELQTRHYAGMIACHIQNIAGELEIKNNRQALVSAQRPFALEHDRSKDLFGYATIYTWAHYSGKPEQWAYLIDYDFWIELRPYNLNTPL